MKQLMYPNGLAVPIFHTVRVKAAQCRESAQGSMHHLNIMLAHITDAPGLTQSPLKSPSVSSDITGFWLRPSLRSLTFL